MKYALVHGRKTHARDVVSGTIGHDLWFSNYAMKACVGNYLQYWAYIDERPRLPPGYEPESEWHATWKQLVRDECTEVVCGNGEHRADILAGELVVEVQRSRIDVRDAFDRVAFYRKQFPGSRVVWIVHVVGPWSARRLIAGKYISGMRNVFSLNWVRGHKHKWVVDLARTLDTHVYLEFNERSDKLIKAWVNEGSFYGSWVKKIDFFAEYLQDHSDHVASDIPQVFGLA